MTLLSNHWRSDFAWLGFATLAHAIVITLGLALQSASSSAAHTDIMAVTLLPMAAPTPTSSPAKTQPVKTAVPKRRLSEPAAITQAAVATPDSAPSPAEAQIAKSTAQTESAPLFVAAHDAAYLNNPRPVYPTMSRRLGEQGKVMLEVHVQPDGSASKVNISKSSGYPRLDEAALDSVKRWRFVPAKQGNDNVAQVVIIPMPFVLEK